MSAPLPPGRDLLDFEPVSLRARSDGWTPDRQRAFIDALAVCGIVREAAARVGMSERSANYLRRRADAGSFNRAWDAAIRFGADQLRSIAYDRAINGVLKPHYYRGRVVGMHRVYDNRLLAYLLGKAPPVADEAMIKEVQENWEGWLQAVEDGLDRPPPTPAQLRSRVWQAEDGRWWTDFPPLPGFNGEQAGRFGDKDYKRECTLDELAAIEAERALERQRAERDREAYFFGLGKIRQ